MKYLKNYEVWFVTGSQHLYGKETLEQVAKNSQTIVKGFNSSENIPVKIVFKKSLVSLMLQKILKLIGLSLS